MYIPATAQTRPEWKRLDHCVWDGPDWLEVKPSLKIHSRYREVRQLFKDVLGLRNADWIDFVGELSRMREREVNDAEKTTMIYRQLYQACQTEPDPETLRYAFSFLPL